VEIASGASRPRNDRWEGRLSSYDYVIYICIMERIWYAFPLVSLFL